MLATVPTLRRPALRRSDDANALFATDLPLLADAADFCRLAEKHGWRTWIHGGWLLLDKLPNPPDMPTKIPDAPGELGCCLSLLSPDPPQTLLFRLCLTSGDFAPVALLPGWCGAVTIADDHTIWAGVGEQLLHFPLDSVVPDVQLGEFGLIRFLSCQQSKLLISDPWAGRCLLMDTAPPSAPHQLYAGECGGCCFASCRKGTLPDWKASLNEP